jgi:hypothetical protein
MLRTWRCRLVSFAFDKAESAEDTAASAAFYAHMRWGVSGSSLSALDTWIIVPAHRQTVPAPTVPWPTCTLAVTV